MLMNLPEYFVHVLSCVSNHALVSHGSRASRLEVMALEDQDMCLLLTQYPQEWRTVAVADHLDLGYGADLIGRGLDREMK